MVVPARQTVRKLGESSKMSDIVSPIDKVRSRKDCKRPLACARVAISLAGMWKFTFPQREEWSTNAASKSFCT